jgi:transcriptional regulator with XRE-family HTH domain
LDAALAKGLTVSTTADLARAAGVRPAMISKWFRGLERPGIASLRRVSTELQIPLPELMVLCGHSSRMEIAPDGLQSVERPTASLALRIDFLLGPDSPIPPKERRRFAELVEIVIDSQSKWAERESALEPPVGPEDKPLIGDEKVHHVKR